MRRICLCVYVKSPPLPPLVCLPCLKGVYPGKQGRGRVVFFCFNLVSRMTAIWMSCTMRCLLSCCCYLFCMPSMFVVMCLVLRLFCYCLRYTVSMTVALLRKFVVVERQERSLRKRSRNTNSRRDRAWKTRKVT